MCVFARAPFSLNELAAAGIDFTESSVQFLEVARAALRAERDQAEDAALNVKRRVPERQSKN
jgi:hypothetical protein